MRKLKYRARLWFFSLGWGTQNVLEMTLAIGTLLAATAVGGLVFSALETDTARAVFPATCPKADTTAAHLPTLRRRLTVSRPPPLSSAALCRRCRQKESS